AHALTVAGTIGEHLGVQGAGGLECGAGGRIDLVLERNAPRGKCGARDGVAPHAAAAGERALVHHPAGAPRNGAEFRLWLLRRTGSGTWRRCCLDDVTAAMAERVAEVGRGADPAGAPSREIGGRGCARPAGIERAGLADAPGVADALKAGIGQL